MYGHGVVRRTNWAGNITFQPTRFHEPSSVEELQAIVAGSERVSVLGTGHSFNGLALTDGDLVSLRELPMAVEVDASRRTVTVNGRMTYADLGARLNKLGYALPALASLPHISVAGACVTATHGSGGTNGNLATAVAGLEIVLSTGDLVRFERGDERWEGMVVSLGALGVIVRMTLDVIPTFDVRQTVYERLPRDVAYLHFDDIFASAFSISMFTAWADRHFDQVWVKRRVGDDEGRPSADFYGAAPADGPRHPATGARSRAVHCTEQGATPGPWHERLPHFRAGFTPSSGEELQSEYLVPRGAAVDALRAVDGIRDLVNPVLQICEVRTVAADDLWLSPCYQRDMVGIHFTWVLDSAAVLPVVARVEKTLEPFGAVPHWSKVFTTPPDVVRSQYPKLSEFQRLADDLDASRKFRNSFVDRYL